MPAPKGNNYWQFRDKHGRPPLYAPEELWSQYQQYVTWLEENPLIEQKPFGTGFIAEIKKMRAQTLEGFCLFADISDETFRTYEKREDYLDVVMRIRKSIYVQKFEGAAGGFLESNIIARELGLKDSKDISIHSPVLPDYFK